ncbi:hypothetical protein PV08_08745 [Exophiala spinifera]|uniref:Transcription factor domain-containing protein n=1 Tax=Exophiala spinifera TaxID=91928 RepID=A0A0D1ZL78_9EURO|nr:uncharacterized protein PV08_08745 [Exophiala spinifera]KIW13557.1 hypothetical protein PV08_08745 [Exophiala spinifera]
MSAPVLTIAFEPDDWPEGWPRQSMSSTVLTPELRNLGTGFFTAENVSIIDDWHQKVLVDLVRCVQMSQHAYSAQPNRIPDPECERWLYLKVQALNYRLLARTELDGIQEALRIATLLWILSVTEYVGAELTAIIMLPKLQAALEMAKSSLEASSSQLFPELHFWMSGLGALVSLPATKRISTCSTTLEGIPYDQQFNFFSLHMAQNARRLRLETTFDAYHSFLQKYLYMNVNGGAQGADLKFLVEAVSGIDQDSS